MASKVIIVIVIAASIASVFTQPPVKLDERHLRVPADDNNQLSGNGWQDSVPGLPGKDYPNLTTIPVTSFTCEGKTPGGYYADVETRCQVFHVCSTQGSKSSFLCPSGSIFNQRHFVCDWWYDFECQNAPELYSLNAALEEPESSPVATLEFNSLGGPSTDLSLASSGYSNNLRDEANLFYKAYTSPKTVQTRLDLSTEKVDVTVSSDNRSIDSRSSVSPTSVLSNADATRFGIDNYPHQKARQKESGNSRYDEKHLNGLDLNQSQTIYHLEENNGRTRNLKDEGQSTSYRTRPAENRDVVPRGFSKSRADEQIRGIYSEYKRNDYSHGLYVNDGLSTEIERQQNNPLPTENNNVEYKNDNEIHKNINNNDNNNNGNNNNNNNINNNNNNNNGNNNNNYNDNNYDNNNNNNNYYYGNENNEYKNYHEDGENNPVAQKNNNHVNQNTYSYNDDKNNATNNAQYNEYSIKNVITNNDEKDNNYYDNYYQEGENGEFSPNRNRNLDYSEDNYGQSFQVSTATPHSLYLDPTEDEADRERQREVDSVDLKRQRPQRYQDSSSSFRRAEETFPKWQDDLSISGSDSERPAYTSDKSHLSYDSPSLSTPSETTESVVTVNGGETRQVRQRPKFLGRAPAGGLPSGSGNGLPGAKKILAASDSITGKPKQSAGEDSDQVSVSVTGTAPPDTWNQHGLSTWDEPQTSYVTIPHENRNANIRTYGNNRNNNNNDDYHEFLGY